MSLCSLPIPPISDVRDQNVWWMATNIHSFNDWQDFSNPELLNDVLEKWQTGSCICEESCALRQCASKRVNVAVIGRTATRKKFKSWMAVKLTRVYGVPRSSVRFRDVMDLYSERLEFGRAAMESVIIDVVDDGVEDDGAGSSAFVLSPSVKHNFRWTFHHFLAKYRRNCRHQLESMLCVHLNYQRKIEDGYGDSYIANCVFNLSYFKQLSPLLFGDNVPEHMILLYENLTCMVTCEAGHPRGSQSACRLFLEPLLKGPVGPLPDGAGRYGFLKFLEAALVPILTSGDAVTNVNRLLASEGEFLCIWRFL